VVGAWIPGVQQWQLYNTQIPTVLPHYIFKYLQLVTFAKFPASRLFQSYSNNLQNLGNRRQSRGKNGLP